MDGKRQIVFNTYALPSTALSDASAEFPAAKSGDREQMQFLFQEISDENTRKYI